MGASKDANDPHAVSLGEGAPSVKSGPSSNGRPNGVVGKKKRRRWLRLCVELCLGLIALAVLAIGIAAWRLNAGPVSLDFMTPELESVLAEGEGGLTASIGATELEWGGWSRRLDIHIRNVDVFDREGRQIATFPDIAVELSLTALIKGQIAPKEIELFNASVEVSRDRNGGLNFGAPGQIAEEADGEAPDFSEILPLALDAFAGNGEAQGRLAYIELLGIFQGTLILRDEVTDSQALYPLERFVLRRGDGAADGQLELGLPSRANTGHLSAQFVYDPDAQGISADLSITDFEPQAIAAFVKDRDALDADLSLDGRGRIELDRDFALVSADLGMEISNALFDLSIRREDPGYFFATTFERIKLSEFRAIYPDLDLPFSFDGPLEGLIEVWARPDYTPERAQISLTAAAGQILAPDLLDGTLQLDRLETRVIWDEGVNTLTIENLDMAFDEGEQGPVEVGLNAVLRSPLGWQGLVDGRVDMNFSANLGNFPVARLPVYWPFGVGGNARPWVVENLTLGEINHASTLVSLKLASWDSEPENVAINGDFSFHDLEVHFLRPLPPVTNGNGSGTFRGQGITFAIDSAELAGMPITSGLAEVYDLDTGFEQMRVSAEATGRLRDALAFLDHPRLDLLSNMPFGPEAVTGQLSLTLDFDFPLLNDLSFSDMTIGAHAQTSGVTVVKAVLDRDLSEGEFTLDLDRRGMDVVGSGRLAEVPVTVTWRDNFEPPRDFATKISFAIDDLTSAGQVALGLDLSPTIDGPVDLDGSYTSFDSAADQLAINLDLTRAPMVIDELGWQKAAGESGTAELLFDMENGQLATIPWLHIMAGDLFAEGTGVMDATGENYSKLSLASLAYGQTNLNGVDLSVDGDAVAIRVAGGVLDVQPILGEDEETDQPAIAPPDVLPVQQSFEPLLVQAPHLDKVIFGEDRFLHDVSVSLRRGRAGWEEFVLSGGIPESLWSPIGAGEARETRSGGQTLQIEFLPDGNGSYGLHARTGDFGAALRALDLRDTVVGGRMGLDGTASAPLPNGPLEARLDVEDYVLKDAPGIARLLAAASLTNLGNLLDGEGIAFHKLTSDFVVANGRVDTDLIHAYGPGLGLTAEGWINLDYGWMNLRGTVVPFREINTLLDNIPLIGDIFTGSEGEGIFGVTYTSRGPIDDPDISVNPLSILTPGFLRDLFQIFDGDDAPGEPVAIPDSGSNR